MERMSFVSFFYAAASAGEAFDADKAAEYMRAGRALSAAMQANFINSMPDSRRAMQAALAQSCLAAVVNRSPRSLYHLAKYLAVNDEHLGAGQLLEAQERRDKSMTQGRAVRLAAIEAMRETKAIRTRQWKAAVSAAATRLFKKDGWPDSDAALVRNILDSEEISSLDDDRKPSESSVRAAIRELGLGAKARREAIRRQNRSISRLPRKRSRKRRVA